jgi:hypothetical protein
MANLGAVRCSTRPPSAPLAEAVLFDAKRKDAPRAIPTMAGHPVPIDGWRTTSAPNHCLARAFLNELGTAGALDKKTSAGRAGARSRTRVYGARDRVAVAIDGDSGLVAGARIRSASSALSNPEYRFKCVLDRFHSFFNGEIGMNAGPIQHHGERRVIGRAGYPVRKAVGSRFCKCFRETAFSLDYRPDLQAWIFGGSRFG